MGSCYSFPFVTCDSSIFILWLLLICSQYCQVYRFPLYECTCFSILLQIDIWVILVWGYYNKAGMKFSWLPVRLNMFLFVYWPFSLMYFLFNSFAYFMFGFAYLCLVSCFSLFICRNFLYMPDTSPLLVICATNSFSHFLAYWFILFMVFVGSPIYVFSFIFVVSCLTNIFLLWHHKDICLYSEVYIF